jgi:hypothetical protein
VLERPTTPVRLVPEPKPGGIRWLARLDPGAAFVYAASVSPLVPAIEGALPPAVTANRVTEVRPSPPAIRLEAWRAARTRFRRRVRDLASSAGAALMTDVRDCYGSIGPSVIATALREVGGRGEDVERVLMVLRWLADRGVRGLPVGPEASAVLANGVLLAVDRRLAEAGWAHVRWVDDIIVFTDDAAEARAALELIRETLGGVGLALASEKTRVLVDPAAIRGGGPTPPSGLRPRASRASG